ncbi:MAG: hypothetical protein NZO16_02250, partial [Deltaproteobacteria bacterium]|nr:hypothetical protein [Deltaproteobacteria bacterium]
ILEIKHRLTNREVSLNEAINPEGLTVEEVVPDRSSDVEEEVFKREFAQQIRKSLDLFARSLPERERQVFYRRVLGENKDTLQELSDSLGVSIERVRQIESKIKDSLKQFLFERFKDEILASD